MSKKPNKSEQEHQDRVRELGCLRCGKPAAIHHVTCGMNTRSANHLRVLPLCGEHHQHGKFGDCIHNGKKQTEKNWGETEAEMLDKVKWLLEGQKFYKRMKVPF